MTAPADETGTGCNHAGGVCNDRAHQGLGGEADRDWFAAQRRRMAENRAPAAVPDSRFRDQLVVWFHGGWCTDDHADGDGDPWCAQQASDLMSLIAAHVEARVQAAANQRAEEVGRCGDEAPSMVGGAVEWCRLPAGHLGWHRGDNGSEWTHGAAALASPAPAPPAEERQR